MTDLYDEGKTPWDMIIDLHNLLEEVVQAHNNLAHDHEQVVLALKRAEAKIEELRRLQFGQHSVRNIQRPNQ